jgi:hypothetical protein
VGRKTNKVAAMLGGVLILICASSPFKAFAGQNAGRRSPQSRLTTEWQVSPSFKFDLLCFLNALTGDSFYLSHYQKEYDHFAPQLTPKTRAALANLKRKIKDENGNIVSAFLSLHFSATDDETIPDMLRTLARPEQMKSNLKKTTYFDEGGWRLFASVRGDLKIILSSLDEIGFSDYWKANVYPQVSKRILTLEKDLTRFNVISEVERHVGLTFSSNRITVYLLYFSRPHGIRITGTRFIVDVSYPLSVIVQNAVHEMLHPPYNLKGDRRLREALNTLKSDSFLMDKILNHNRSFGYNSFESFIEEDCVRALEQIITEKMNIGREPRRRWRDEDDGMHVFAVALYSLMKRVDYDPNRQPFAEFLTSIIASGDLKPGKIQPIYNSFYQH